MCIVQNPIGVSNILLPKCQHTFCESCLFSYLDNTSICIPKLESLVYFSDFSDSAPTLSGLFYAKDLSSNGLKKVSDLEKSVHKSAKTENYQDEAYAIRKTETFRCPTCFVTYHEINRLDLVKNRVVKNIIKDTGIRAQMPYRHTLKSIGVKKK